MKTLEKELEARFAKEEIPEPNYDMMWRKLQTRRKTTKRTVNNHRWIAITAAAVILVGTSFTVGKPYLAAASQSLVQLLFGNDVKEIDPYASVSDIERAERTLQLAKEIFSEKEWIKFSALMKESTAYVKQVTTVEDGVRTQNLSLLTKEEKAEFDHLQEQLKPYLEKLNKARNLTVAQAQAFASFPVAYPSYIPEGYELALESAELHEPLDAKQNPIVQMEYKKGEFGFRIFQSPVHKGEENDFDLRGFEDKTEYTSNGIKFILGEYKDSNVKGMKVTMPETETSDEYQIVIIADVITKEDMEKIATSIIKN
jgi:hypothetical protein